MDVGSGAGLPTLVFLCKELLFGGEQQPQLIIAVEMVPRKLVKSRCLISVFRKLEFGCRGIVVSKARIYLVPSKFEDLSSQIVEMFKGIAPLVLYFNNAASGMDSLKDLHGAVIEVAKTTKALFCVADPAKCANCEAFDGFAALHVSRNMFRYNDVPNMSIMTCISSVLGERAAEFGSNFQRAYSARTAAIDEALKTHEVLLMLTSAHKAKFKKLDFDTIVVDCVMTALEELGFNPIKDLTQAELTFSAATQFISQFLSSTTETFVLKELKNQKMYSHCYGNFRFLNFVEQPKHLQKEITEKKFFKLISDIFVFLEISIRTHTKRVLV